LEDVNVSGKNNVGGLVGYVIEGSIENCQVISGSVEGKNRVGGLVGNNYMGEISASSTNVEVFTVMDTDFPSISSGGLAGVNEYGFILDSHVMGKVSGQLYVGGLVGENKGHISNSYADGEVNGMEHVGGLVGINDGGIIHDAHAATLVSGTDDVGGLVGINTGGLVDKSYAVGNITGNNNVGGLVGFVNNGEVSDSYATGKISGINGSSHIGGLIGRSTNSTISGSYASGDVSGDKGVGGLVGALLTEDTVGGFHLFEKESKIYKEDILPLMEKVNSEDMNLEMESYSVVITCYAIGHVKGNEHVGGLVGLNNGSIFSSYYDRDTTGQSDQSDIYKGEPRSTEEMKLRSTYVGWNFIEDWGIEDGKNYPMLRWQEDAPQSGFNVDFIDDWAEPGVEFELEITDAIGEDGEQLNSLDLVTVYSDLEDKNVLEKEIDFSSGKAIVPVILDKEGIHNLRIYVEGISYSNLITLNVVTPKFKDGSGTPEDPFQIENAEQLDQVRHFPTAHFKLVENIDLGISPYNTGDGWEPIGRGEYRSFEGSFDGNGYVIENLYINLENENIV
jgi:hypothetical protein